MKSRLAEVTHCAVSPDHVETHDLHEAPRRSQLPQGLVRQTGKFAGLAGPEERVEKLLLELARLGMEDLREFLVKRLGTNSNVMGRLPCRYRFQMAIYRRLKTDRRGVSTGFAGGQRTQELGTD
jgi:hypothetical protein